MSAESTIKYAYNSVETEANKFERQKAAKSLYERGYDLIHSPDSEEDISLGVKKIFQAQSLKYPQALYAFGCLYMDGEFVKKNTVLASNSFTKAIESGNKAAEFEAALAQFKSSNETDMEAYRSIKSLSNDGFEPAYLWLNDCFLQLSKIYWGGNVLFRSISRAKECLIYAVEEELIDEIEGLDEYISKFDGLSNSFYRALERVKMTFTLSNELVAIADNYLNSDSEETQNKSFELYKRAAGNNNKHGLMGMAQCYEHGVGCTKNIAEANRLYKILTQKYSMPEAAYELGVHVEKGLHIDKDGKSSFYYFCKSASLGSSKAALKAFEILDNNIIDLSSEITANLFNKLPSYYKDLVLNNIDSSYTREELKIKLLLIAVDDEIPEAYFQLANLIENLSDDNKISRKYYKLAAENCHHKACYEFAQYLEREGNLEQAHGYYYIAAKNGISDAFYIVAWDLYKGDVCKKNIHEAEYWFERSADLGHVHAMYVVGYCHIHHRNSESFDVSGVNWLKRAAELGSPYAHYELGQCYQNGWGVQENYLTAKGHYNDASSHNAEEVAERLEELDELVWEYYEENHSPLK
ncbi:SEL1-like repeat protein [Vibrio breoganii]|uniref:SEL1-like repeat protein n=1 Tax=Vibrio breoganii TaxID=553239 RepID=UPI000C8654F4|nr:SEL1-like repeat protein [Vibrio breoganii]PMM83239.1 hypothetical protein BCT44_10235 [Vibrio breoganii]